MSKKLKKSGTKINLSFAGIIVTLGIVYGDIGTSPLYVFRAILGNHTNVDVNFVLGGLSCIIWTLTLQTTIKYILITLKADNKGEGGILALFALLRRKVKWVYIFAVIGGATLLADGVITPSITVISAIEGLNILYPDIPVIPIVILILLMLFIVQQFGTNKLGYLFGPVMIVWFVMLGVLGMYQIIHFPDILKAFNPYYAWLLLTHYSGGFLLLGAVFLCTTGAEALYSDLGHCGIANIRTSWIFVKFCLIFNYLGQGAYVLSNEIKIDNSLNPFYSVMPQWFLMPGIIIATLAAIIASQALISGSYTLISEAIQLNFWPKVKIKFPTITKGQMYISSINWLLCAACIFVVLFFKKSVNMEAAYGLSITITMLMTTSLMVFYLLLRKRNIFLIFLFFIVYLLIEGAFLIANLHKFPEGGWFTILLGGGIFIIMYVSTNGRKIKNRFLSFVNIDKYKELFIDLSKDQSIIKHSTNLVYLTKANRYNEIESKIIYSIFNKQPKKADLYWFVHIDILDEPHIMEYKVSHIIPNLLIRLDFRLGFKVETKINLYFRQVVEELVKNNEINNLSNYESLRKYNIPGDFKFIVIDRIKNYDFDFKPKEQLIIDIFEFISKLAISDAKAFGLDTSNVFVETVPLIIGNNQNIKLIRKE